MTGRSWAKKTYRVRLPYDLARAQYLREYPRQRQKSVSLTAWRPANTGVWSAGGVFHPVHFPNPTPTSPKARL